MTHPLLIATLSISLLACAAEDFDMNPNDEETSDVSGVEHNTAITLGTYELIKSEPFEGLAIPLPNIGETEQGSRNVVVRVELNEEAQKGGYLTTFLAGTYQYSYSFRTQPELNVYNISELEKQAGYLNCADGQTKGVCRVWDLEPDLTAYLKEDSHTTFGADTPDPCPSFEKPEDCQMGSTHLRITDEVDPGSRTHALEIEIAYSDIRPEYLPREGTLFIWFE
jgi:hypothetical protein